jgi:hypothetical protein
VNDFNRMNNERNILYANIAFKNYTLLNLATLFAQANLLVFSKGVMHY